MPKIEPYSLLIYSTRTTDCLYHKEWQAQQADTATREDRERLLFGLLFSLRRTALKMSPQSKPGMFSNLTTSGYKLHFYQTSTGYMFVLLTPPNVKGLRQRLINFYSQVFLTNVVMNPLYELDTQIKIPAFETEVEKFDFIAA
ncbi:Sybindin-like family protein [Trichomonas vaginalis G3]|uniref:Trafficking protein particle complex subunit n=1 Tax=Trichomonas vaginalis (strain ATCC PRA-98 / G3) TaxID=412133 RepID=A2FTX2_TRIV3|nr:Rab guanyl-nucleotide exchange factor protein [Trichomonas vaginalis G3]EAX91635.1 Sybindin-like family protein [Trichomonas vaginalis G3]KAI5546047.1 Rab guanyl-nucleotide exchange factor protein [Trichomonas vaginalis G3]|eukprot:XP_001304565.1 Sybindin-like family protein [Trichomonas vaginalis G3]